MEIGDIFFVLFEENVCQNIIFFNEKTRKCKKSKHNLPDEDMDSVVLGDDAQSRPSREWCTVSYVKPSRG